MTLKELRQQKTNSLRQAAEMVGMNRYTWYCYETGRRRLPACLVGRVSSGLGVELSDVVRAAEETHGPESVETA